MHANKYPGAHRISVIFVNTSFSPLLTLLAMDDNHRVLHLPPGISVRDLKGGGTSGLVALFPGTKKVIKFSLGAEDEVARCTVEGQIYERFHTSHHRRPGSILDHFGTTKQGIILEYAENGNLRQYLQNTNTAVNAQTILRWARQLTEALVFSHSNGVLHGDLNCSNLFLDGQLNLKLGDFAGSSIDGSPAMVAYSPSHRLPNPQGLAESPHGIPISVHDEIFALGSTLYEMVSGNVPHASTPEITIKELYKKKSFPDTSSMYLGLIISDCWNLRYQNMQEVLRDIDGPSA